MALIGTLREKMGTGVVIFVFVAISAFVLNDLLGNNSILLGSNNAGEIAGHTISLNEFQQSIQEQENNYILNFNRQPGDREMPMLREQAWELLILRYAIQKQYGKVGIEVPEAELVDMISGDHIDENLKQSFTNQETGQFDRARLKQYIDYIKTLPDNSPDRIRWNSFYAFMRPGRERIKYENLLIKSAYVTAAEAEMDYHMQNDVAEIKYLYVPYYSISDTAVSVSDSDLKAYYTKNKEKYKSEFTRDLKYITVPVVPSSDDSIAIRQELDQLVIDLKASEDDSTFAAINSDGQNPFSRYTIGTLPTFVKKEDLTEGNIIGPTLEGSTYRLFKVSEIGKDTIYSAKASHILIRWSDNTEATKKEAKDKALGILKDIKAGADFTSKAREFGTDGTASTGGDLGWFVSGQMVKPFEKAVFSATKKGLLNDVVETDFGYHIIDVTELKDNSYYSLAVIEKEISPSDASINSALRKAEIFASELSGVDNFVKKAESEGLRVFEAKNIGTAERRVGTLGEARQIVQWLFRDGEVGKVSDAFDVSDEYVVAVMTGEVEKGYKPLEVVKEEITPAVRNEIKGKKIIEKLNSLNGTLEEIVSSYGKDANVSSNSSLKLNSNSLTAVGFDPIVVGVAFSVESGKRSVPFAGENGVVIIEMQNKTTAPAIADYAFYKNPLEQTARNRNTFGISEAIKEAAKIDDKRYKFY